MNEFIIKPANIAEMAFFLELAKNEGWNPGLHDALPFYTADPRGFFIGELNGEKIGCISTVAYNESYGFLGLYIVKEQFRGHGWGLKLWNHAISYMESRTIGLDGVLAQQANYRKSGFELYYRNIRYEGHYTGKKTPDVKEVSIIPIQLLLNYDAQIFGAERSNFIKKWISMPNAVSFTKIEKDKIVGYGVIRQCVDGYKIGPLFADNQSIAQELFENLSSVSRGEKVIIDIPEINIDAMMLVSDKNFKATFETARMYTKTPPIQLVEKVFGVTSFELG